MISGNGTAATWAFWKELVLSDELDQHLLKTILVIMDLIIGLGLFLGFLRQWGFFSKQSFPTSGCVSLLSQLHSNLMPT